MSIAPTNSLRNKLIQNPVNTDPNWVEKKIIFKLRKAELPLLARIYLYLKKKQVTQILFVNELDELSEINRDMQKGKRSIYCDLELIMKKDINRKYHILN